MFYLRCVKGNKNYIFQESNSEHLQVLYIFLAGDFIGSAEWFKKSVQDDSTGTGGNVTFLDKMAMLF